jgi:pimeloyl-ACP methyl ester carboxylesterase
VAIVTIDGRAVETRLIAGKPAAPWLVFLHEGLGCASLWRDFPDKLAHRLGAWALVYSRFGYGRSAPLEGPREPDFMHREALDVLPALLAHHGIVQPVLVGHSDGASIALIHAASHPAGAVVLLAPHVLVEDVSVASIARISETYRTTDLRERLARHHDHVDDAFLGWSRIWLDPRFRSWSLLAEARRLACPALLIQGEDDEYGSLAQLDAIEAAASGPVERLVLRHCGHAPQREQEAVVHERIARFIERLPA